MMKLRPSQARNAAPVERNADSRVPAPVARLHLNGLSQAQVRSDNRSLTTARRFPVACSQFNTSSYLSRA